MGAGTTVNATVGVEPMGSHLVVATVPGHDLAGALTALPHVLRDPTREPHRWSVPAVPVVARAVRSLVALQPDVLLEPAAEALLTAVEALPETATAVAHFCEHKPGVPGVVIAMEPDPDLRAAFAQLPQRRHDPVLDRFWIPARDTPLEALGDELDRLGAQARAGARRHRRRGRRRRRRPGRAAGLAHGGRLIVGAVAHRPAVKFEARSVTRRSVEISGRVDRQPRARTRRL